MVTRNSSGNEQQSVSYDQESLSEHYCINFFSMEFIKFSSRFCLLHAMYCQCARM